MKVSIVTGTYNSEKYISSCLTSVNAQTYKNIEHIIIDGLSSDNTLGIINNTPNRVGKVVSEADKGIYDAMNKGIRMVTGDIVGILNSDDYYQNDRVIETVVSTFEDTGADCVYGDLFYITADETGTIKRYWQSGEWNQKKGFLNGWHPAHPSFFVKASVYEKYGLFDLDFKIAADFDIMLRFIEHHKLKIAYIPEPLVRMRLGGASSGSLKNILKGNGECIKAFKKYGLKPSKFYTVRRLFNKLRQYDNVKNIPTVS